MIHYACCGISPDYVLLLLSGRDCDVPIVETSDAAIATPNTNIPKTNIAASLISTPRQYERAQRKNGRHPKTDKDALFLVAAKPKPNGQKKGRSGSGNKTALGHRIA